MSASGFSSFLLLLLLATLTVAKTVTYNWDVTWVNAAPDGFSRPVVGINGQWPNPPITASVGDTIVVNLNNKLGNETTGLHFHGISQAKSSEMDGPSGTTQCPVPPGSSITYKFLADAPGTYWYHSHNMGQYPDGLRGPLIVYDPADPYKGKYDEEVVLTVSDWYHRQSVYLVREMLQPNNTGFLPPFPDSAIVNEGGQGQIKFEKGKTYRVRIISFAAFASAFVHFDSHPMDIIMIDGSYVQKDQADQLRVSPAQRYDVLITANDQDNRNYPFLVALDINGDYTKPNPTWPNNFTGQLVMDGSGEFTTDVVKTFQPKDESQLKPLDGAAAYGPVDNRIVMDFAFCVDQNNIPRACLNGQTYIPQEVPTMYSVATTGEENTNPAIYGDVNPFVVSYGQVVEIVINNKDASIHPFHLHGHQFQIIEAPASDAGSWPGNSTGGAAQPPKRDVVQVNANSYAVLRFEATNPGVFLFHCHIEWHVEMGLTASIIEAPEKLRGANFPSDHIRNCKIQKIPSAGNAAGNTRNYTDTTGFKTVPDPVYTGALYPTPLAGRPQSIRRRL